MVTNTKIDIFRGKESEIKQSLETKGYDAERVKAELERIEQNENRSIEIDENLRKLEQQSTYNVEEHVNFLLSLLNNPNSYKKVQETPKDKSIRLAKETYRKGLEKTPLGGIFLVKLFDITEKEINQNEGVGIKVWHYIEKMFATGLLYFFGYHGFKKGLEKLEEQPDIIPQATQSVQNTSSNNIFNNNLSNQVEKEKIFDPSVVGLTSMLKAVNVETKDIGISLYNLGEEKLSYENIIKKNTSEKYEKEAINGLRDKNFRRLAESTFTTSVVERILKPRGEFNKRLLNNSNIGKDRLEQIDKMIKDGTFTWEKLTIFEISSFYIESFPVFSFEGLLELTEAGKEVAGKFGGGSKEILQGLEDRTDEILPRTIIKGFLEISKGSSTNLGGWPLMENSKNNEVVDQISIYIDGKENLVDEEKSSYKEKLKNLVEFKDYIISDNFLDNQKLGISNEAIKDEIRSNLDYTDIIALYFIMNGEKSLDNLSMQAIVMIMTRMSDNIDNYVLKTEYETTFFIRALSPKSPFGEDDKALLDIYGEKFGKVYLKSKAAILLSFLGGVNSFNENYTVSIGLVLSGTISHYIGNKIDKAYQRKGITGKGNLARKFGNVFYLFSFLSFGSKIYSDTYGNFSKKLNKLSDKDNPSPEYIKGMLEYMNDIEKNSIHRDIDVKLENGETEKRRVSVVFDGDGKRPFIMYNNRVWKIEAGSVYDRVETAENGSDGKTYLIFYKEENNTEKYTRISIDDLVGEIGKQPDGKISKIDKAVGGAVSSVNNLFGNAIDVSGFAPDMSRKISLNSRLYLSTPVLKGEL